MGDEWDKAWESAWKCICRGQSGKKKKEDEECGTVWMSEYYCKYCNGIEKSMIEKERQKQIENQKAEQRRLLRPTIKPVDEAATAPPPEKNCPCTKCCKNKKLQEDKELESKGNGDGNCKGQQIIETVKDTSEEKNCPCIKCCKNKKLEEEEKPKVVEEPKKEEKKKKVSKSKKWAVDIPRGHFLPKIRVSIPPEENVYIPPNCLELGSKQKCPCCGSRIPTGTPLKKISVEKTCPKKKRKDMCDAYIKSLLQ